MAGGLFCRSQVIKNCDGRFFPSPPQPNPGNSRPSMFLQRGNRRKVFCILDLWAREIIFCVVRTPKADGMAG